MIFMNFKNVKVKYELRECQKLGRYLLLGNSIVLCLPSGELIRLKLYQNEDSYTFATFHRRFTRY